MSDDPKALLALEPCPWCQRIPKTCPDTSYRTATVFCSDDHDCPVHPIADADLSAGETLDDAVKRWNQRTRPAAEGVLAGAVARICFAPDKAALSNWDDARRFAEEEKRSATARCVRDAYSKARDILALLPKPVEGEIEAVVKWLRKQWGGAWEVVLRANGVGALQVPTMLADAIERGDYRPTPTSDGVRDDG